MVFSLNLKTDRHVADMSPADFLKTPMWIALGRGYQQLEVLGHLVFAGEGS